MSTWLRIWIVVVVAIDVAVIVLTWALWDWLTNPDVSPSEVLRNTFFVLAAPPALLLAVWRSMVGERQAEAARTQAMTAQRGLLDERYQRGAEMLGSGVLAVRMGGIYALERLAKERPGVFHIQIMQLLCAFARNPVEDAQVSSAKIVSGQVIPVLREDVQAVLNIVGRRGQSEADLELRFEYFPDLSKANLQGALFFHANLQDVNFSSANLFGANFILSRLDSAMFVGADLAGVRFVYGGESSVTGLTQEQIDFAVAQKGDPPNLEGILDAETGKQIVWKGNFAV